MKPPTKLGVANKILTSLYTREFVSRFSWDGHPLTELVTVHIAYREYSTQLKAGKNKYKSTFNSPVSSSR